MKRLVLVATCLLLLSPAAWAGAYVGGSLGQSDASTGGLGGDETSWKILGGYTFTEHVALEGSYRDLGGSRYTIDTTELGVDVTSLDVFGVGMLPVGTNAVLFAKAGIAFLDVEASISDPLLGSVSASDSESELAYGAGVDFQIAPRVQLRAEYERFNTSESFDMLSVGATFKF